MAMTEKAVTIEDVKYFLLLPTIRQINDGDVIYSKYYLEAMKAGIKPRIALEREYRETGIWDDARDKELLDLSEALQDSLIKVRTAENEEAKNTEYTNFLNLKAKYQNLASEKNFLFQHTAESKAETAKITTLLWQSVLKEDKTPLWKDETTFLDERDSKLVTNILREFVAFLSGIEEDTVTIDEVLDKYINLEDPGKPNTPEGEGENKEG